MAAYGFALLFLLDSDATHHAHAIGDRASSTGAQAAALEACRTVGVRAACAPQGCMGRTGRGRMLAAAVVLVTGRHPVRNAMRAGKDESNDHVRPDPGRAVWDALDKLAEAVRDLDEEVRALAQTFGRSHERKPFSDEPPGRVRQSPD